MKVHFLRVYNLTIACSILLLSFGCKNSNSSKSAESLNKKIYEQARIAGDYTTCLYALNAISLEDTSAAWVWDSLVYYHYFYNGQQGGDPKPIKYYLDKGLKTSKSNLLKFIKSRIDFSLQEPDAVAIMENLWSETKNFTYLFDLVKMKYLKGNVREADSLMMIGLNSKESETASVDFLEQQYQYNGKAKARAAFVYLEGQLAATQNNFAVFNDKMKQSIQIDSTFQLPKYLLQRLEYERMQNGARR